MREASREGPSARPAVASVEELVQLLALWRPGAAGLANEASYLAARFGGQRPAYFHAAVAPILDPTHEALLFTVMWTFTRAPVAAPPV